MKPPADLTRRQRKIWKKLRFEVVDGQKVCRIDGKLDPKMAHEIADLLKLGLNK